MKKHKYFKEVFPETTFKDVVVVVKAVKQYNSYLKSFPIYWTYQNNDGINIKMNYNPKK